MKNFFLPLLLSVPFWVNAQVYYPLVDSGAVWNVMLSCDFYGPQVYDFYGRKYAIAGDTVIQSTSYHKLLVAEMYHFSVSYGNYSGYNYNEPLVYAGVIREDTDKKVWYWEVGADDTVLLYDFDVQVNDTMPAYGGAGLPVTSIDSVQLLDGSWRKRFNTEFGESVIEGIGSTASFINPLAGISDCISVLSCYRKNDVLLYGEYIDPYAGIDCDNIALEIPGSDLVQPAFEISPNPASDFLTVNFSSPFASIAQLKITNVLGQVLVSDEIESGKQLQIRLEEFYGLNIIFCELWHEGVMSGVKKILIQK